MSAPKGHFKFSFTKNETSALVIGQDYSWCCTVENSGNSTVRMLHANRDYGTHSPAMILEGPVPLRQESQIITVGSLSQNASSALVGAAQVANFSGVHSLVFGLDDYTGTIVVQATIDDNIPDTEQEWTTISTTELEEETSNKHIGFVGNYMWVRFIVSTTTGIDSISYRNL